jgi:hypothetical protein
MGKGNTAVLFPEVAVVEWAEVLVLVVGEVRCVAEEPEDEGGKVGGLNTGGSRVVEFEPLERVVRETDVGLVFTGEKEVEFV